MTPTITTFRAYLAEHGTGRPIDLCEGADKKRLKAFSKELRRAVALGRLTVLVPSNKHVLYHTFKHVPMEVKSQIVYPEITITAPVRCVSFDKDFAKDGAQVFRYKAQPGVSNSGLYCGASSLERI